MPDTIQNKIDKANPNDLAARLRQLYDVDRDLGFGALLAALRPRNRSRTGLANSATQVHDRAATIITVETPIGTPLAIVTDGTPAAGQVNIAYNATTGIPTLTFNAAVTEYHTTEQGPLPQTLVATLATQI